MKKYTDKFIVSSSGTFSQRSINQTYKDLHCKKCFGYGYQLSIICDNCNGKGIPPIPLKEIIGYED